MASSNITELLHELKSLGTEQAAKTYKRHGVGNNVFGVSYSDLGKFKKKLKINHDLAIALWNSGIHDAQILALMIADPEKTEPVMLEKWVGSLSNYVITDAFSGYTAQTRFAQEKAETWTLSDNDWISSAGWSLIASIARHNVTLQDAYFENFLQTIERTISTSPNRTRHTMNNALIAIGGRNPDLQEKAIAAAQRIGKVKVDHGLTDCKTPDAVSYIQKMVAKKSKV